jgi:hypothetical protein
MKMSVRMSFSSGRPRASAFTRGRGFTHVMVKTASARTRKYVRAGAGPRGRGPAPAPTTHVRASARARDRASARTRVDTRRADAVKHPHGLWLRERTAMGGGNLGKTLSFPYKGGRVNIFPPLPTKLG